MSTLDSLKQAQETVWLNPDHRLIEFDEKIEGYRYIHLQAAQNRFMRFLPYIASAFPETAAKKGLIESPLIEIPAMADWLRARGAGFGGRLLLKDDARLPIAGSVKARGGVHAVMHIAEKLMQKAGMMQVTGKYGEIDSDRFREFFGQYTIQVGSTGNLGISIGRTAARMGFRVIVHMSADAKEWKKELLRSEGVIVREYDTDYSAAVAAGREASARDDHSFFIDDENSEDLFFGYSVGPLRMKMQLRKLGLLPSADRPVFVYLPCGVGGAPGGITFGMRQLFPADSHCFFAEPVQAPCITLGMATGEYENICVQDIGLTGRTAADGLAVGRPSGLACRVMKPLMSGAFTVTDEKMALYQQKMMELEKIRLETSACAGFAALEDIGKPGTAWAEYIEKNNLTDKMDNAVHIVWGTGGGLLPE